MRSTRVSFLMLCKRFSSQQYEDMRRLGKSSLLFFLNSKYTLSKVCLIIAIVTTQRLGELEWPFSA